MRHLVDQVDIMVIEAMAGIDAQAACMRMPGGAHQFVEFTAQLVFSQRRGEGAGVQLNKGGLGVGGGIHLREIRINEQADQRAVGLQHAGDARDLIKRGAHIQAAFGGQFLAAFRHQARAGRRNFEGALDNGRRHGHFQIELGAHRLAQADYIGILNMAAVFAQMNRDAGRAGHFREGGRDDRIGHGGLPRLAQGCNVIYVDA